MDEQGTNSPRPTPPRGIFSARVDDKGRLKLPSVFSEYFKALNVDTVFITTLDLLQARIYTNPAWEHNENLFAKAGDASQDMQDIAFIANHYGADSEIDAQGRVLFPTELRRELKLEGQQVWLDYFNGRINVFDKERHDERMQRARVNLLDKLKTLERDGLK